uniref:Uncharacterized protein n=1 Tax=Anguilla anguilla TaxID=7936 RepID=A0A0E9Q1X4_ANGAN
MLPELERLNKYEYDFNAITTVRNVIAFTPAVAFCVLITNHLLQTFITAETFRLNV